MTPNTLNEFILVASELLSEEGTEIDREAVINVAVEKAFDNGWFTRSACRELVKLKLDRCLVGRGRYLLSRGGHKIAKSFEELTIDDLYTIANRREAHHNGEASIEELNRIYARIEYLKSVAAKDGTDD